MNTSMFALSAAAVTALLVGCAAPSSSDSDSESTAPGAEAVATDQAAVVSSVPTTKFIGTYKFKSSRDGQCIVPSALNLGSCADAKAALNVYQAQDGNYHVCTQDPLKKAFFRGTNYSLNCLIRSGTNDTKFEYTVLVHEGLPGQFYPNPGSWVNRGNGIVGAAGSARNLTNAVSSGLDVVPPTGAADQLWTIQ